MNPTIKKSLDFIGKSNFADAILLLKKTLRKTPKDQQALNVLGQIYLKQDEYEKAIETLEQSIAVDSSDPEILFKLAYSYEKVKNHERAVELYKQSIALNPKQVTAYNGIGRILGYERHNYEALIYFFKVLELGEADAKLHSSIACIAKDLGLNDWTLKHYQLAFDLEPHKQKYLSSLLFNSHKDPTKGFKDFQDLAVEYCEKFVPKPSNTYTDQVLPRLQQSKSKLRLGFVSADLRRHPVSYYLFKVLLGMNQDQFEFVFYHNNTIEDDITVEYKKLAKEFHVVDRKSDEELAKLIFENEIDILFDMSGFTAGNRLALFRAQAAPVQVSHIGYFGTVGMPEMDFVVVDDHIVRPEEEKYFTETVYRMDHCSVHCASLDLPSQVTAEAPCMNSDYVTFGSKNSSHKINPQVITVWAQILEAAPNTKLLIDNQFLSSPLNQEFIEGQFEKKGIAKSRLILKDSPTRNDFLKGYADIDIALDPFPYGGGTSTIESLMMGVPVISINGDRWMGRQSADFLINSGHAELVAKDANDYIAKAVKLAAEKERIQSYRASLRTDMQNSEMSLEKYIPRFEKAVWDMWQIKSNSLKDNV